MAAKAKSSKKKPVSGKAGKKTEASSEKKAAEKPKKSKKPVQPKEKKTVKKPSQPKEKKESRQTTLTGSETPGENGANDKSNDMASISKQLARLEKKVERQEITIKELRDADREGKKKITGLERKLETRIKREELMMQTLGLNTRSKPGGNSRIRELNQSILKAEEYLLNTGDRIDNILSAVKNHREYLVKLNRRVYKLDAKERIEIQLDVISNTLSIMMLSGFDFDKSLLKDVDRIRKMMEKKDAEIVKLKKKMENLDKKFEEELERFDFKSIYEKKKDIPGYH